MKTIAKPRGSGKTTKLIKMSAKSGSYIVCLNQREAGRIFDQARNEDKDINFPITYDEFINKRYYGKGIKGFLIDEIGLLVQCICRDVGIEAVTLTLEKTITKKQIKS